MNIPCVMIVGKPGIGKSRLVEEFRAQLGETPHSWIEWSSSQLLQNTPLHPLSRLGTGSVWRSRGCAGAAMLGRCSSCARMAHKSFHNGRRIAGKLTEVTHSRRVPAQLPHGSKRWAEANEPRGTVFQFTLPGAGS